MIAPKVVPQITDFDAHLSPLFYFAISVSAINRERLSKDFHARITLQQHFCSRECHFESFVNLLSNFSKLEPSPLISLLYYSDADGPHITTINKVKKVVQVALGTK